MNDYHPIVQDVLGGLVLTSTKPHAPYAFTEASVELISQRLLAVMGNLEDFRFALGSLVAVAGYLETKLASPDAAEVLYEIIAANPEVERAAALAAQEKGNEQAAQLGEKFAKFSDVRSAAEEEIETTEPSVSAKDLLRSVRMSG